MKIWNFIKSLFIKKTKQQKYTSLKRGSIVDLKDSTTGEITDSAIQYDKQQNRFLKLKNQDCAIVMHNGGKVEIIFSKLYDGDNQKITPEEQTLMSIAIFLKQPGFAEMLRHQFNQIAMRNISTLTEENKDQNNE